MHEEAKRAIDSLKYFRPQLLLDYIESPPVVKAKYFYPGRNKNVELIVIHTMEAAEKGNTAEAVAKYFQNIGIKASAHYCIDNDSIVQCVYDSDTAWHCKNANRNGIGLEHAGFAKQSRQDWLDEYSIDVLNISAQVSAYLVHKFNLPVERAKFKSLTDPTVIKPGFCGHADVPGHGSHWDPGPGFPWDIYLELVGQYRKNFTGNKNQT